MKPWSSERSDSVAGGAAPQSSRPVGSCVRIVDRARCRALFTDCKLVSSSAAVSFADQSSASRRMRMARCLGGRCWMAARYTSSIVSRETTSASGSVSCGAGAAASRCSG